MRTPHLSRTATRAAGPGRPGLALSSLAALATALTVMVATGGAGRAAEPTPSVQLTGVSARAGGDLVVPCSSRPLRPPPTSRRDPTR